MRVLDVFHVARLDLKFLVLVVFKLLFDFVELLAKILVDGDGASDSLRSLLVNCLVEMFVLQLNLTVLFLLFVIEVIYLIVEHFECLEALLNFFRHFSNVSVHLKFKLGLFGVTENVFKFFS